MEERPLIVFTLLTQAAVGAGLATAVVQAAPVDAEGARTIAAVGWTLAALLVASGLLASCAHLGVLVNAWRAAMNWRSSWLSREILATGTFTGLTALAALSTLRGGPAALLQGLALGAGLLAIHCMAMAYRLPTVPAWNSNLTHLSFFLTALVLGSLVLGGLAPLAGGAAGKTLGSWAATALVILTGCSLTLTGTWVVRLPEPLRSDILDAHSFVLWGRVGLALLGMITALCLITGTWPPLGNQILRLAACGAITGSEVLGRALFYIGHAPHDVYLHRG